MPANKLTEYGASLQFRDDINRFVQKALTKMRPIPRYGIAAGTAGTELSATVSTVDVTYNTETVPVSVSSPGIKPLHAGARVRVEGIDTDRYITEVIPDDEAQQTFGRVNTNEVQSVGNTLTLDSATVAFTGGTSGLVEGPVFLSYTPNTSGSVSPRAYKFLSKLVLLSGSVIMQSALTTGLSTVGTLPIGYRPAYGCSFLSTAGTVGSAQCAVRITLGTDGSIRANLPSGLSGTLTITYVYLEGIVFYGA